MRFAHTSPLTSVDFVQSSAPGLGGKSEMLEVSQSHTGDTTGCLPATSCLQSSLLPRCLCPQLVISEGSECFFAVPSLRHVGALDPQVRSHITDKAMNLLYVVDLDHSEDTIERLSLETDGHALGTAEIITSGGLHGVLRNSNRDPVASVKLGAEGFLIIGEQCNFHFCAKQKGKRAGVRTGFVLEDSVGATVALVTNDVDHEHQSLYWVLVAAGADASLVFLALLAADRLMYHATPS